jgi:hypothetical protein
MAKQTPQQDPADVVIFFARARGGGAVVAQTVQALADAIQQAAQPPNATRLVKSIAGKPGANGKTAEKTLFDAVEPAEETEGEEVLGEVVDAVSLDAVAADKKPPKPRKGPTYSFVKDLDLRPSGKQSLKEFFAEKSPPDQQAHFAVIIYYLTHVLGLSNVGIDHVYTALKDVGEKVPNDIAQIARNTANRKGWLDTADTSNLKVTTGGENYVEHDLPKPKA